MKMKTKAVFVTVALGTAMLWAGSAAAGEGRHGWYIGFDAGLNTVESTTLNTPAYDLLEFGDSLAGFGVVGYAFDRHFRLELEAAYRENDLDQVNGGAVSSGKLSEWSGMLNLRYDIPVADRWDLEFGIGAGADRRRSAITWVATATRFSRPRCLPESLTNSRIVWT